MLADELCEPLVNQLPEPNQFLLFNHCNPIQIDEENQSNERRVNTDKGVLADELREALMRLLLHLRQQRPHRAAQSHRKFGWCIVNLSQNPN